MMYNINELNNFALKFELKRKMLFIMFFLVMIMPALWYLSLMYVVGAKFQAYFTTIKRNEIFEIKTISIL